MRKTKIGILCGGPSSEREVSIKSGKEVAKNLSTSKYEINLLIIDKYGNFFNQNRKLNIFKNGWHNSDLKKYDVLFVALHGSFGEDGKIQAVLDLIGVPYTFSGVLASSLGMNKEKTNFFLKNQKINLPKSIYVNSYHNYKDLGKVVSDKIGWPCVVKPNQSGSSFGIKIVKSKNLLKQAVSHAFAQDDTVIIQEYINGSEFTCGVLGNSSDELEALPVVQITTQRLFFDYRAKYFDKKTKEVCPALISKKLTEKIQKQAKKIHQILDCDGLTRSDFIYNKNKGLYFLEINTIPGLTAASLCPKEALAAGYTYGEFLDKIIELALKQKKYVSTKNKSS